MHDAADVVRQVQSVGDLRVKLFKVIDHRRIQVLLPYSDMVISVWDQYYKTFFGAIEA